MSTNPNYGPNKLNSRHIKEIRRFREWGSTLAALACKYGVTQAAIAYHVKDIKPAKLRTVRRRPRHLFPRDEALRMLAFGATQGEIARHFGVTSSSVCTAFKQIEQASRHAT